MTVPRLSRRDFLKTGLGVVAGAALSSTLKYSSYATDHGEGNQATREPNLVFIFADQLRACSVGCYQNNDVDTPNIDRLASEGVRFTSALATSPYSAPYRGCLMTGRYPNVTGVMDNFDKLPQEEIGIAEVFSENGYRTQFVGKWFLNGDVPNPVEDPGWVGIRDRQGFRYWSGFNGAHVYYDSHYYEGKDAVMLTTPPGVYEPDFQTDVAIDFITRNRKQKFCIFMSIGTPHPQNFGSDRPPGGPYTYPYDPRGLTVRSNVDYSDSRYTLKEYADYYGIVSNFDWNVGRIIDALDTLRLTRNTIIVVSSDHGDYLGSHYSDVGKFRGKGQIYAESLDVPCVLRFPRAVKPGVVNDVFNAVDVMPSLLGLCKLPIPDGVMGRDFSPLLVKGGAPNDPPFGSIPSQDSALVGMFTGQWVGLRNQEYTLEIKRRDYVPTKLFHNTVDPFQMNNLVFDPDYSAIRDALHEELLAWLAYVGLSPF